MYRTAYNNAKTVADLIQSGEYRKTKKEPQRQGLIARRVLEQESSSDEDVMDIISGYIASIDRDTREATETPSREGSSGAWDFSSISDFAEAMAMAESSNRSDVQITARSGGREQTMTGLFQFSEDRLTDYMNDTGASFSVEDFRNDEGLQRDVFAWHIADIDRVIDNNDLIEKGYSRDGLRAVAHLGGINGMLRFVRSRGEYDPEDKFGTSLSDRYRDFGGA